MALLSPSQFSFAQDARRIPSKGWCSVAGFRVKVNTLHYCKGCLICGVLLQPEQPLQVEGGEEVFKVGDHGLATLELSPWMAFALDTTTLTTVWGNHRAVQLFGILEGVGWASFVSELTGHLKHHMDITLRQTRLSPTTSSTKLCALSSCATSSAPAYNTWGRKVLTLTELSIASGESSSKV